MKVDKQHPKYWDIHKEIYNSEIDSLDFEIRDIVMNNPHSNTTIRFNDSVDKLIQEAIEESDKQSQ